jgi:acyl-CoA thioesterase FadM
MKFLIPVYIDDKLKIRVTAIEKYDENKISLKTEIMNQDEKIVIEGTAVVSVPREV